MKQEHEYAQVLRWVADGDRVKVNEHIGSSDFVLQSVLDRDHTPSAYKLAPRTITVNGREVPEPVREELKECTTYYLPRLDSAGLVVESYWVGSGFDALLLQRGLIHLTKEAAIAHAKAMLGVEE